ncbi:MAG: thioredoxin family protein [Myxococcales bacterium]|nr:thioredoxin family protein [Myxococcales bacterium]
MVLLESDPVQLGSKAPDFSNLPGTDGASYSLGDFADRDVLVVAFICNHCPYVKATAGRLAALQEEFGDQGVQLIGINANDTSRYPADSFPKMKEFVQEYSLNFPYLLDESQEVAQAYGAVCTPDIFVFDRGRALRYRGRIDDNWRNPEAVTERELAAALTALVRGEEVAEEQKPSIGCSIKWKPGNNPSR